MLIQNVDATINLKKTTKKPISFIVKLGGFSTIHTCY